MSNDAFYMVGINPVLESSIAVQDPNTGLYIQDTWKGSSDAITFLVSSLGLGSRDTDQRFAIDDSDKPLYRMVVTTPDYTNGQSNALNKWELIHNKIEKDITEHPTVKLMNADEVDTIRSLIKNNKKLSSLTTPLSTNGAYLYDLMVKGQTKTLQDERVFRYSVVTSKRFGSYVSEVGLYRLWSTHSLTTPSISGLIIPAQILFNLNIVQTGAPWGANVISPISTGGPSPTTGTHVFAWSWLKQPPDVEQLPSGKVRISQEWWLDYWSTWEYPIYP